MPAEVNEVEWKFLVEYFSSDSFKVIRSTSELNEFNNIIIYFIGFLVIIKFMTLKNSNLMQKMRERNKANKAKQEIPHICGRKSFRAVSFEKVMRYFFIFVNFNHSSFNFIIRFLLLERHKHWKRAKFSETLGVDSHEERTLG